MTEPALSVEIHGAASRAVGRDIIVIGASAGGIPALREVVSRLPADLPAAVFVVLHLPAGGRSYLVPILARSGRLPTLTATDGEAIVPGRIYVAPPNRHHLTLDYDGMHLAFGPRENSVRPAADTLFRSAAQAFGPRVIGVLLSGAGVDGSRGLQAIIHAGGVGIVQDPADARFPGMPQSAIARDGIAYVLPARDIADRLTQLARESLAAADPPSSSPGEDAADPPTINGRLVNLSPDPPSASPIPLTCPSCGSPLWEDAREGEPLFACRVGHAWSDVESLSESQADALESAGWGMLNALAERALIAQRLAHEAPGDGQRGARAARVREMVERLGGTIRELLPPIL